MTEPARLQSSVEGRASVTGALSFSTVEELAASSSPAVEAGQIRSVDLAGVTAADSAGLALMVEWQSLARACGVTLVFENIPAKLMQLAHLSDLDELIGERTPAAEPAVR